MKGSRTNRAMRRAKSTTTLPRFQDFAPSFRNSQEARHFADQVLVQKKRTFEADKERLDQAYEALPQEFQRRFDRFRRNNPEFRWRHEAYEMMVSEEAIRLAEALKSPEAVEAFLSSDMDAMRRQVPSLSWDTHTQKSFTWTVQFAHTWLTDPARIEDECAALCSMVGCEAMGCGTGRYSFPNKER